MPGKRAVGPSKRGAARLFEYQGLWLGLEAKTGIYNIHWYAGGRRVKRKTTGTRDLEEAKQKLIEAAQATPPDDPQNPTVVDIAAVKRFYFEHHVTKRVRDTVGPARAYKLLLDYLAHVKEEPKVASFTLARQVGFMKWLAGHHDLSNKTISTYLSYIKAGFRFASRPHLIKDMRKGEREVQILSTPPHIDDSEERVARETKLPVSQPREWTPTDAELAAMLDAAEGEELEGMFRYMIMALNTWARPEAITQLSVLKQVDWDAGIITLNPPGRAQNKKRRPRIRLTDNLRAWLLYWNLDKPIVYFGRPVGRVDNRTLKKVAERAGVDPTPVNRYMLRHYMATRIRRTGVSKEQRELWLGHADPKHRQTAWYESFDPDYLEEAMRGTDAIMLELNQLCRRRALIAPTVARIAVQLSVIQGNKTGTLGE
jgi:integrase